MARLRWTPGARQDLADIYHFIAQDSPENAADFVNVLTQAVAKAADFPFMGRKIPDANDDSLREIISHRYRIAYVVSGDDVVVMAVAQGSRDLNRLLEQRRRLDQP